jgi:PAS domain S-box-containing protein
MDAEQILNGINVSLKEAMQRGMGKKGLSFPFALNAIPDGELKDICECLSTVFDMINESYRFSEQLAQGKLNTSVSRTNIFSMPLKGLQASLAHLTWQANQVASGDLNQKVHFLGEFSESFNRMIKAIREKRLLEQQFKLITDVLGEGIFLVDNSGKILFSNPESCRLLGYSNDELAGTFIQEVICKQQANGTLYLHDENPLFEAIKNGINFDNEGSFTCRSGLIMPVNIACRPIQKDESTEGAVVAFRDISEQKKYLQSLVTINELLEKQATTDPLTGIYNRIKFDQSLLVEAARADRYGSPLTLISRP